MHMRALPFLVAHAAGIGRAGMRPLGEFREAGGGSGRLLAKDYDMPAWPSRSRGFSNWYLKSSSMATPRGLGHLYV